jgi:hypothetical protein
MTTTTSNISESEAQVQACVQVLSKILQLNIQNLTHVSYISHSKECVHPTNALLKTQHTFTIVCEEIVSGELYQNTIQPQSSMDIWSNQGLFSELSGDLGKYNDHSYLWGHEINKLLEPPLLKIEMGEPVLSPGPLDDSLGPLDNSPGPLDDSQGLLDNTNLNIILELCDRIGHKQEIVI